MIESAEEFIALRTSERPNEYGRAAREAAPEAVWRDVIARYPGMRVWVAHNKTVPAAILWALADDAGANVCCMVAMRRVAPAALLEKLARDSDPSVRQRVAANATTPRRLLALLAQDQEASVAQAARARAVPRHARD